MDGADLTVLVVVRGAIRVRRAGVEETLGDRDALLIAPGSEPARADVLAPPGRAETIEVELWRA